MATAEQIKALLRSYSDADGERFVSVAMQIAAHAARTGKGRLASELKELIQDIRGRQTSVKMGGAVPIVRPSGELASVLSASYPSTRLSEMVLAAEQTDALQQVVLEYRQKTKLSEFGLCSRRKLLLIGPPGCGKTMTSHALAGELKLPHFAVQLHSLITKFMGETAAKLHTIFEAMQETRGVYLFDEFDAIGSERAAGNDVGEIRRVLNSFLQFLEQDESDSLVIAATNCVGMLDEALFRRFDDIVRYGRPDEAAVRKLIQNRLASFAAHRMPWKKIIAAAIDLSHAEICRACDDAAKDSVLKDKCTVAPAKLVYSLEARKRDS
jgi:SpoVK/Ycf46/Vps4 family AAA+-type ATPase